MMSYKEAYEEWAVEIKLDVVSEFGEHDYAALAESWAAYTDTLTKQGKFNQLLYHYCPAHDSVMPDDDMEYILGRLNVDVDIVPINNRPDYSHPDPNANHYRFSIERAGNTITGYGSAGIAHGFPTESEIMAAVFKAALAYESAGDICSFSDYYGYEKPSQAIKTYKECKRYYGAINDMFSNDEREGLQEVFNEM